MYACGILAKDFESLCEAFLFGHEITQKATKNTSHGPAYVGRQVTRIDTDLYSVYY
jgi:hypothetical protein